MSSIYRWLVAALLIAFAVGAGLVIYRWQQQRLQPVPDVPAPPAAEVPAPPQASASVAGPPPIQHPIEEADPEVQQQASAAAPRGLPRLEDADAYVADALVALVGRDPVLRFLDVKGFVRDAVATVDNLSREHATPRLWPVNPMGKRMLVEPADQELVLRPANAQRYTAFVDFVDSVDTRRAAALYVRLYPLFQQAYEELGYPGRYFNDRLVATIDHLLQTPELTGPVRMRLTEVKGPYATSSPWLRYEFADPALQSRSAGQKILLRVGSTNAQRLKAKLREFRAQISRR